MARYMKATYGDYWLGTHKFSGALLLFFNFFGGIAGALYVGMRGTTHISSLHSIAGIAVFCGLIVQLMLGTLSDELWDASRTSPPLFPDRLHWYCGRMVLVLAIGLSLFSLFQQGLLSLAGGIVLALWIVIVCVCVGLCQIVWENPADVGYEVAQEGISEKIRASVRRATLLHRTFVFVCVSAVILLILTWVFVIIK